MLKLDEKKLKKILTTELGYDSVAADRFAKHFPPVHDELVEATEQWLKDRTVNDVSISELSIKEVMRVQGYHFLLAIREMNRLLDKDLTSDQRQSMIDSLRRLTPQA